MVNKTSLVFLPLLLLVLVFVVAFSDAAPTSRSQVMFKDEQEVFHHSHAQDVLENGDDSELLQTEGLPERRMDIETTDYPGTGPNKRHDPRTPPGV